MEDADNEQCDFAAQLTNLDKEIEIEFFKITYNYYLVQEKISLALLKADYFQ